MPAALSPNQPSVRLHNPAGYGQAQAAAPDTAIGQASNLVELVENLVQFFCDDARPCVRHTDQQPITGRRQLRPRRRWLLTGCQASAADLHPTALGRELDGVAQQVDQHLPDTVRIALNEGQPFGHGYAHFNALGLGLGLHGDHGLLDDLDHV